MKLAIAVVALTLGACASMQTASPPVSSAAPETAPAIAAEPKFTSEARWETAGYNNDEIVYTILITSQDSRILRCNTRMQGYYLNAGTKTSIADQQISTVFPNQQVQAGIWLDMDQSSGSSYQVKCRPA